MSESVIIELNQSTADKVEQNGIYHVTLAQPITVNPGDQLYVRMASINSPQQDANTIVIPDNQSITATFSYYDVDYDKDDKKVYDKSVAWPDATFDYFAGYNITTLDQVDNIVLSINGFYKPDSGFNHPGGSYVVSAPPVPSPLGQIDPTIAFYARFSYVDNSGNLGFILCSNYPTIKSYPISKPEKNAPSVQYGMLSGAEVTAASSINVGDGQLLMVPLSADGKSLASYPKIVQGSLKLIGLQGGWPGGSKSFSQSTKWTFPSIEDGSEGATIAGTKPPGTNPYDIDDKTGKPNFPFTIAQFSIARLDVTSGPGARRLDVRTVSAALDSGRYDTTSLSVKLTQLMNNSQGIQPPLQPAVNQLYVPNNPLLTRIDDSRNADMVFRRIDISSGTTVTDVSFTNDNTYVYEDALNQPPPYILGAQQFSLEFGNAGEAFQLSYAHTPFQQTGHSNEQKAGIFYTGTFATNDLRYYAVTAATGIVFHDLEPKSLWRDQLALDAKLTVPLLYDDNGLAYYERDQFLQKITYGFLGLDGFPIPATGVGANWRKQQIPPTDNPTFLDITGASRAIIGDTPIRNIDGGVYYVEILNVFRNRGGFVDNYENRRQISAVVSTQYQNNEIVTGYADSGIPIIHQGSPYVLTEAFVRILGGASKTPVDSLGSQNTIFLQLDRAQAEQQQQIAPRPKTQNEKK